MKKLFKNAKLFDPSTGLDGLGEILVMDGKIADISLGKSSSSTGEIMDLKGGTLLPGLIDVHVHLREPGEEFKETIASGANAAAAGGFTTICAMPNTKPVNDSVLVTKLILERARLHGGVRVHPISAASKNLDGKEMVEYGALLEAGCVAVSDDGRCVMDPYFARMVLEYLKDFDVPFIEHCEDCRLSAAGSMNEGAISFRNGLKGVPHAAEDIIVDRDISLARLTKGRLHLAHLSSRFSVASLKKAKAEGLKVTGEVTPHHLLLTDQSLEQLDTNYKMAPPLRSEEDRKALVKALEEGTIDSIATDHAPHSHGEKRLEFPQAPNGIIGLETAFPVCMTLVEKGELSFKRMVEAFTVGPASVMGFQDRGSLKKGSLADFCVVDLDRKWKIDKERSHSLSRNTPFHAWNVTGQVVHTIVGGEFVLRNGELV